MVLNQKEGAFMSGWTWINDEQLTYPHIYPYGAVTPKTDNCVVNLPGYPKLSSSGDSLHISGYDFLAHCQRKNDK